MNTKRFYKVVSIIIIISLLIVMPDYNVYAKSSKSISLKKLCSERALTLKEMPSGSIHSIIKTYKGKKVTTHTIQNFSYTPDLNYIFTVGECNTGSKKHTLLTVSKIKKGFGDKKTSICIDAKILGNYGHGDAIAITECNDYDSGSEAVADGESGSEDTTEAGGEGSTESSTENNVNEENAADESNNEVYDVWVASAAGSNGFGTCIDRLTIAIEKDKMAIKKKVRIKNFAKANVVDGKAARFEEKQDVKRMNVAADRGNNQIVFRIETSTEINYVAYNLKKLDKALDKVKNGGKYDIAKAAKMQLANVRCNVVPRSVFQSFRVSKNTIYICGGYFNNGAEINTIKYKTYKPGKSVQQDKKFSEHVSKVIKLPSTIKIGKRNFKKKNVEVEGMDFVVKDNGKIDVHINYYAHGVDIRNGITIFRFSL